VGDHALEDAVTHPLERLGGLFLEPRNAFRELLKIASIITTKVFLFIIDFFIVGTVGAVDKGTLPNGEIPDLFFDPALLEDLLDIGGSNVDVGWVIDGVDLLFNRLNLFTAEDLVVGLCGHFYKSVAFIKSKELTTSLLAKSL
jgi:hypothetical protein